MSADHLARLAAQHARTALLMGVDFVPSYRSAGSALARPNSPVEPPAPNAPRPAPKVAAPSSKVAAPAPKAFAPASPPAPRPSADPAAKARALDTLRERYAADAPHAAFGFNFTNIVFGEGDPSARLLFVGEAPGEDEDRTGRPFVGRAGQLLEKMIAAMGLSREQVYICNVLKVRPPDNRPPTPKETIASAPYLYEQIATVDPEVIVTLGRPSSTLLLNSEATMGALRGRWSTFMVPPPPNGGRYGSEIAGRSYAVMPTYHPSYVLRVYTDETRKAVWSDLRQVLDRLGLVPPKAPPSPS